MFFAGRWEKSKIPVKETTVSLTGILETGVTVPAHHYALMGPNEAQ